MLPEVLAALDPQPGHIFVDGTLGGSGHALALCQRLRSDGRLIGLDQDAAAVANARKVLAACRLQTDLFQASFVDLAAVLKELQLTVVNGILLDLGLSRYQLEASGRGFSFLRDEPLDMRMDTRQQLTAAHLVAQADVTTLTDIFFRYGEERYARIIAKSIVASRQQQPITSSAILARLVSACIPAHVARKQKIHPATRVFMALRIAVNNELEVLRQFMAYAPEYLADGGRIAVLAFHSLEDRIVKQAFQAWEKGCDCSRALPHCICGKQSLGRRITRKALRPGPDEIQHNAMARSTRLRVFEKA